MIFKVFICDLGLKVFSVLFFHSPGNYFAGGQNVNNIFDTAPPISAKMSQKHQLKDNERLVRLGMNPVDKLLLAEERQKDRMAVFHANGSVKFRTHLSDLEKKAIKDVAQSKIKHNIGQLI